MAGASAARRCCPLALHSAACCGVLTAVASVARLQFALKRSRSSAATIKLSALAIYARLTPASHRTATTKPQPQLASCHQRSGPEASSTCPPRDLCSILRRRLNRGTAPSIEFPGTYARTTQFIMANPIACTSVPCQITAPHQFSCNRGTRSLRKTGGSEAWSWPARRARSRCTQISAPSGARAAADAPSNFRPEQSKIRHGSKKPSRFRHRKKPSQSHRSSSTCPSAASRRGASR